MKELFSVKNDYNNTRVDKWYKKNICEVPQALIEKNIRKGNIRVNYKRVKSSYKLKTNDLVIIKNFDPQNKNIKKSKTKYEARKKEIKSTTSYIIEDNENFIIINKPAGLAVQSGTKSRRNILDILRKTNHFNNSMPYSVHRIDKETTGVLIIAKNRKYAQLFTSLFRIRKIHKTYLAIVIGEINQHKGTFDDLLRYQDNGKETFLKAISNFEVIDSNNYYTFLKIFPKTGRKHQIRKQLYLHDHPILGDKKYRNFKDKKNKKSFLMLHAFKISFSLNNKKYNYTADIPEHFRKALNQKYLKNF